MIILHKATIVTGEKETVGSIVVENGRIAEQGKPSKLLADKGVYHKLYMLQYQKENV